MTRSAIEQWAEGLASELDLDIEQLDVQALLDVARDAAHSVVRPAAPLATFLVGYAAGRRAAAGNDIERECEIATQVALNWEKP